MRLFRVVRAQHAHDLSGAGAALYGGRWNSKGKAVLYAAGNARTAQLEVFGKSLPRDRTIPGWVILELELTGRRSVRTLKHSQLPLGWDAIPFSAVSQAMGDTLLDASTLAIRVPSARAPRSFIYVINTAYADIERLRIKRMVPLFKPAR